MVTGTGKILLVEDDLNDVFLTERALKKNGVRCGVVVARDGEEALDYHFGPGARTRGLPQFVMLDLRLPKVDGLEVLRRLRADGRTRDLPVVLLVSSEGELGVISDRGGGGGGLADLCVRKVVDFERFVQEVGQVRSLASRQVRA